jgi:hypothetical protein
MTLDVNRRDRDRSREDIGRDRGRERDNRGRDEDNRSRDERGKERHREVRDRVRDDRDRDRHEDNRSRDYRRDDCYRRDDRDRRDERGRHDGRDRRDDRDQYRDRDRRGRDGGSVCEDTYRRGSDSKDAPRGKESVRVTAEDESRARRKDLVLYSKSELSRSMRDSQAADTGSKAKHVERDSDEPSDRKHEAGSRDEDNDRERKRTERGAHDVSSEIGVEEGPGLYMDSADIDTTVKRRARSPIQPYRPPIALLSKKERSRVSSQGSVLDRLGTASANDAVRILLSRTRLVTIPSMRHAFKFPAVH